MLSILAFSLLGNSEAGRLDPVGELLGCGPLCYFLKAGLSVREPIGNVPPAELTPVAVHFSIVFTGDKSPKATSKVAAQKQAKAAAASQKKKDVASAKQVPKK